MATAAELHAGGEICDSLTAAKNVVEASLAMADATSLYSPKKRTRNNQSMKPDPQLRHVLIRNIPSIAPQNTGHTTCKRWADPFYRPKRSQMVEDKAGSPLKLPHPTHPNEFSIGRCSAKNLYDVLIGVTRHQAFITSTDR